MKKENLKRANECLTELSQLEFARDLIKGGGVVGVYGDGTTTIAFITDNTIKTKLLQAINYRIAEIEKEIEEL